MGLKKLCRMWHRDKEMETWETPRETRVHQDDIPSQDARWRLGPSGGCADGHEVTYAKCITWIYHEPEWGGILQNKDPAILNRRKITSEEGLRCRNEWAATKATKVTSVDEALTKLLKESGESVRFVRFNAADGSDFRWCCLRAHCKACVWS